MYFFLMPVFSPNVSAADLSSTEVIQSELSKPEGEGDLKKVIDILEAQIISEEPGAEMLLAFLYYRNPELRNIPKAFHHFSASARTGEPVAQKFLAQMYSGVASDQERYLKDFEKSYMWFSIAKLNGADVDAEFTLSLADALGTAGEIDAQEAARKCLNSNYKLCD